MQKQKVTQSTQQKTQSRDSRNPQNQISIRKAAAKLKQKQTQLEIIKKRFQVLRGQQNYNRYRTLDQQRRIKQHQSLHQSLKTDRLSLQKQLMQLRQKQEKQLKERHDKMLQQMKEKSKDAYGDLMTSRISQYSRLKQQSKFNDQLIEKNKRQMIHQNNKRKQTILAEQKKQKQLVNQFKNGHIRDIIGGRSMEASRLSQITNFKDKQLQRLMQYQQQMLKKASQSIAMNQKLKTQFGKVFVEVKRRNSLKFPSISRQSGTYGSNQSSLSRNLSIYEI